MDWTGCRVVERCEGKLSGAVVVRRSRVRPEDVLANREAGAAWIANAFDLAIEDVEEVLAFEAQHRGVIARSI